MNQEFPKILFIGAVTFEEISGSHSFFYRLFTGYPADRLMVIGSHRSRNPIFPPKRLPDVSYIILEEKVGLMKDAPANISFFSKLMLYHHILKQLQASYDFIEQVAKKFNPDLILTLSMDYYWYLAYQLSKRLNIPLELVLHDRWESSTMGRITMFLSPNFRKVFKYARHRFCISPSMENYYYNQLGIHSDILYPISRIKVTNHSSTRNRQFLNLVFFGNIWYHHPTLIKLAHVLYDKNIELVLFSNKDVDFFKSHGLKTSNVTAKFFLEDHEDLLDWCRANADILYLPMHFDDYHKQNIKCSFPSKIADYTSLGLPIIIHAPSNSSVAEFAAANSGCKFAEVVTSDSEDELAAALDRLMNSQYREQLGRNSLLIWHKFFDPEVVRSSFFEKIFINASPKTS
jgi:hypothetical protein